MEANRCQTVGPGGQVLEVSFSGAKSLQNGEVLLARFPNITSAKGMQFLRSQRFAGRGGSCG